MLGHDDSDQNLAYTVITDPAVVSDPLSPYAGMNADDVRATNVASTTAYASADVPKSIPDLRTITSTLTISDNITIADLNVELSIAHPYDADMDVYLIAPDRAHCTL